ncbi:MAG: hypothetical protein IJE89_05805 [Bacilli bacterium]|nr:hypothetical protein [Bacilli bacterium]
MKKNLIFILIITILLVLVIFIRNRENNTLLTEEEIKEKLLEDFTSETVTINDIGRASDILKVNNNIFKIEDGVLNINGNNKEINIVEIKSITGYYNQPSDTYNLYLLTEKGSVYKATDVSSESISNPVFNETELKKVDSLLLIDLVIIDEMIGQTPERNRVYAEIEEDITQIKG